LLAKSIDDVNPERKTVQKSGAEDVFQI
jgi:hypothetical protein